MAERKCKSSEADLGVDFLVESSFLQLQLSLGVGHFGVCLELDVHHLPLTLGFLHGERKAETHPVFSISL